LEGTLKIIYFQTPCHGQGHLLLDEAAQTPPNLALNTAREGAASASLGNLCQGFINLTVKNLFLLPNLNLLSFSLKPLLLVLCLQALAKGLPPAFV